MSRGIFTTSRDLRQGCSHSGLGRSVNAVLESRLGGYDLWTVRLH